MDRHASGQAANAADMRAIQPLEGRLVSAARGLDIDQLIGRPGFVSSVGQVRLAG
jgi:hypothetical protein